MRFISVMDTSTTLLEAQKGEKASPVFLLCIYSEI